MDLGDVKWRRLAGCIDSHEASLEEVGPRWKVVVVVAQRWVIVVLTVELVSVGHMSWA